MSTHYRNQIRLSCQEAEELLQNQKIFPVPARLPTHTNATYTVLIQSTIQSIEDEINDVQVILNDINSASDRWMSLRTNMTGAERTADTPLYDAFATDVPFQQKVADLRRYTRKLRDEKRQVEAAMPPPPRPANNAPPQANPNPPPPIQSLAHLPKTTLPTFSGSCAEYLSFWNSFKAAVNDLPTLSNSIKFTYLKQCVSGPPLTLINSLPVTDASYQTALDLLKTHYGNEEDVARSLHQSLRKLPRVRSGDAFCSDLRNLVDQIESICVQLSQQNQSYNTIAIQMEIEERLPRFVLTEIFKAKEDFLEKEAGEDDPEDWTTDQLKQRLRTILKRQEHIESLSHKDNSGSSSGKKGSPRPQSPTQQISSQNSSLTFHTQNENSKTRSQSSQSKITPHLPCLFCSKEGHFSTRCESYPDVKSRTECLRIQKRCFKCLKSDHFANKCPSPAKCSNCSGLHPRPLCPNKKPQKHTNQPQSTHFTQNQTIPIVPHPFSPAPSPFANTPMPTFCPQFYPHLYQHQAVPSLTPTPIVPSPNPINPALPPSDNPQNQTNTSTIGPNIPNNSLPVLLKCVRVQFFNPKDTSQTRQGILLLDDASNKSYITTSEAKALSLPLLPTSIQLGVFYNSQTHTVPAYNTTFGIRLVDGRSLLVHANAVDHLTQPTSHIPFSSELLSHNTELVPYCESVSPVILLGGDFYYDVEPTTIMRLPSGYRLIQTLLGPIVAGKAYGPIISPSIQQINVSIQEPVLVPPQDFFTLESIGITDTDADCSSDDLISQKFNSTIEFVDNRYQVHFPWMSSPKSLPLPTNYGLCWGRLRSVVNTLSKTPTLFAKYDSIIQDQLRLGIIEQVDSNTPSAIPPPLHYLAHHPVINQAKGKVRIVYDGSAQTGKALSLNDCLHPGPVILPDLVGLLLRFRIPKVAIACDLEKAFLQVSVHPSDRNCTRFLWLKDINSPLSHSNLQIYRFARVPFGLSPSPFLLAATIQYHLTQFPSPLSMEISKNIYVDNILLSAETPEEGQQKCKSAITLFSKASMRLCEFISNSPLSLSDLANDDKLLGPCQKFLGIEWCTFSDSLAFQFIPPPTTFIPSKRSILAFVASHFDPMGLLSPVLLPLKTFLQNLWLENLAWDEPLSLPLRERWQKLTEEWNTEKSTVPRQIFTFSHPLATFQLHCFADASGYAMCAAVYLRASHPSCPSSISTLLFSKTKVKPSDKKKSIHLTIPRLELIAALMGTRALKFIQTHLTNLPIESTLNLWTDSSAVLAWLNSSSPIREIFVQNRINSIRKTPNLIVRHTPGIQNPADIGSRGLASCYALNKQSIWWNGPIWLNFSQEYWPSPTQETKSFSSQDFLLLPPPPSSPIFTCQVTQTGIPNPVFDTSRFSRLPKTLRSIAFMHRFIFRLYPSRFPNNFPRIFPSLFISPAEVRMALQFIVKQEQTRFPPLDRDNECLGLFLGPDQLLRSKGRLGKSRLPPGTIEPIYLPPQSHLTQLIIFETHLLNHHASPLLTLSLIRRQFWVPKGRKVVERAIAKSCLPCRRFTARPFDLPPFPPFPIDRVQPSPPFSSVGLDFCGPLYIKARSPHKVKIKSASKPPTEKVWICLWVCLATRGISLDLVNDQSSPSFALAYRRFCAKYGFPSTIYCDNAPTFVSFSKSSLPTLPAPGPNWNFRAPGAAWKGGHYERTVALIKFHLRRTMSGIYHHILPYDQIHTILSEIETIINSRPISYDSANPADTRPLRPINFIRPMDHKFDINTHSLDNDPTDPEFLPESNSTTLTLLWNHISATTLKFWERWHDDYLLSLRERYKKLHPKSKIPKSNRWPIVGEMVLVHSEAMPRSLWTIALIQKVIRNESEFPDVAEIKFLSGNTSTRSVHHLYPLETSDEVQSRLSTVTPPEAKLSHPDTTISVPTDNSPPNYIQLRNRRIPK